MPPVPIGIQPYNVTLKTSFEINNIKIWSFLIKCEANGEISKQSVSLELSKKMEWWILGELGMNALISEDAAGSYTIDEKFNISTENFDNWKVST